MLTSQGRVSKAKLCVLMIYKFGFFCRRAGVLAGKTVVTVNEIAFRLAMVVVFAMILSTVYEVIVRYIFNNPTMWSTEVCGFALVILAFLAAAHTQHIGRHVRVDMVIKLFPWRVQQVAGVLTTLLALGYSGVVAWQGWRMAWESYVLGRCSSSVFGPPLFYPQVFIPIGALLLCIEFVTNIYGYIRQSTKLVT